MQWLIRKEATCDNCRGICVVCLDCLSPALFEHLHLPSDEKTETTIHVWSGKTSFSLKVGKKLKPSVKGGSWGSPLVSLAILEGVHLQQNLMSVA